jgi:hypothetical protein
MKYKFRRYWSLIKSLQTGLLLSTGVAGFMSVRAEYSPCYRGCRESLLGYQWEHSLEHVV